MDTSNLINLGLLIATVGGAGIAFWQARIARHAERNADAASASAKEQARKALAAAERSARAAEELTAEQRRAASALERQATLAEELGRPQPVWELQRMGESGMDTLWRVNNVSGKGLRNAFIDTPDGADEQWIVPRDGFGVANDVPKDGFLTFEFRRRASSPSSRDIYIRWTAADGTPQIQHELVVG